MTETEDRRLAACVLAAGKGTRMGGTTAKVLHSLDDGGQKRTMLSCVLASAIDAGCEPVVVVVGFDKERVIETLPEGVRWVEQAEQLGTGHAVDQAGAELEDFGGDVVVLYGDVPLLKGETIKNLHRRHVQTDAAATILTAEVAPPNSYGRIVRAEDGSVRKIVENKDATEEERQIREINTGICCFRPGELFESLQNIDRDNAQGEYYLTDVFGMLADGRRRVEAYLAEDVDEVMGVDDTEALRRASEKFAERRR